MAGRAASEANITKGMNVFLRGNLWDLGTNGTTIILDENATPKTVQPTSQATIACLWL
ncbi:hypothetical protein [Spirosoma foliorum]|uniref:Uncharacterized protein n=1 Tax=Spirosoma foliorum TaxID=2710596 RepID=A0A7G5GTJ5_9BACT|nr:hypothetical protein [Spirosoma foliorum]QMW02187.1 hypothetical protein H3H32_30380 [Spirosoma foliorum]